MFCVRLAGSQDKPLRGPVSNFGYVGYSVKLFCYSSLKTCLGINWFKDKVGGELEIIYNSSTRSYNEDKYDVRSSNEGCQLTVKHLEFSDAGKVTCEMVISQRSFNGTAILLVFSKLRQNIFIVIMILESIKSIEVEFWNYANLSRNSTDYCCGWMHLYTCVCSAHNFG